MTDRFGPPHLAQRAGHLFLARVEDSGRLIASFRLVHLDHSAVGLGGSKGHLSVWQNLYYLPDASLSSVAGEAVRRDSAVSPGSLLWSLLWQVAPAQQ